MAAIKGENDGHWIRYDRRLSQDFDGFQSEGRLHVRLSTAELVKRATTTTICCANLYKKVSTHDIHPIIRWLSVATRQVQIKASVGKLKISFIPLDLPHWNLLFIKETVSLFYE